MKRIKLVIYLFFPLALAAQPSIETVNSHIQSGDYGKAESLLLQALRENSLPELKDKLGEVYAYQVKWDSAIDIYEELSETYPENASYLFRYGGVLAKKAQNSNVFTALMYVGKIKNSFKQALNLDPDSIEIHWALIDLYISLPSIVGGSSSKALAYALELKKLSLLDGHLALGYVYEYEDEPGKAKINYINALNMLSDLTEVSRNQLNYQIGKICSDYGIEEDKGIVHLKEYISNYTVMDGVPLEWAYYRLAKIYRNKSDKPNALAYINRSLEINPDLKQAMAERTVIDNL